MYIVIINYYAGKKQYNKIIKQLKKRLHKPFVPYFTNEFQDNSFWKIINDEINNKKNEILGIIIVGGDGTFHQVINELHHHQIPFGLIPFGSGNDFCRGLKIPRNVHKSIERIITNKPRPYDLLEVNGNKVLSIIGIGVDAVTAIKCQHSKIKKVLNKAFLGRLAYLTVFFQTIFHYKPKTIIVEDENGEKHTFHRVWLLACGNTTYYGGGVPITPNANPQDGTINIVIVHNLNLFQLLLAFPIVFTKRHISLPYVTELNGTKFVISAMTGNVPVQGDGEDLGQTPATVTILKDAVKIY